jgi:hypothetical protein
LLAAATLIHRAGTTLGLGLAAALLFALVRAVPSRTKVAATLLLVAAAGCDRQKQPEPSPARSASAAPAPRSKASAPAAPMPSSTTLGGLAAEPCELSGGRAGADAQPSAVHALDVSDDGAVYLLADATLRRYRALEGTRCVLALDRSFGDGGVVAIEGRPTHLARSSDGAIHLSAKGMRPRRVHPPPAADVCPEDGALLLDPETDRGVLLGAQRVHRRVRMQGGRCTTSPLKEGGKPWGERVLSLRPLPKRGRFRASGWALVDDSGKSEVVADTAAGDSWICELADVARCGLGLCALDACFAEAHRRLVVWKEDGTFVGSVPLALLIGEAGARPETLAVGTATAYLAVTQEARDERVVARIYRVRGLTR